MKANILAIVFSLLTQVAFPQQRSGVSGPGRDYYAQQDRANSGNTKSTHADEFEPYKLELFPGQVFNGWWYFWSKGGMLNANLIENPEVGWLSLNPDNFISTGCANIIPVKFSFVAPLVEGVYTSDVIDNSGKWDTVRVELRVTRSPENCIIRKIGINQDSMSYKSFWRYSPFYWDDNNCVKDYFPANTSEFNFHFNPEVDWLTISPSSGNVLKSEKQDVLFTLKKKVYASTWVTLEREHYSFPAFYHFKVKETEPKEYLLQFTGENFISTGYYPDSSTKTLMYWVRFDEFTDMAIGVHDGENHRFYLGIHKDNSLFAGLGSSYTPLTSTYLVPGKWYHMALVADNGWAIVYINATEVSRFQYSFSGESKANFYIGARNDYATYGYFVNGLIDEVQVWERPLSRTEIINYAVNPPEGNENGLVIYYPFNEGWGNFTKNVVNNYYQGTLYFDPPWIDFITRPASFSHAPIVAPTPPILKWPLDNASDVPIQCPLYWVINPTYGSSDTTYRVQVSLSSDFSDSTALILDQSDITSNSFLLPDLSHNTKYYWRVNRRKIVKTISGSNTNYYYSYSGWSDTWKYTTTCIPTGTPPKPSLYLPVNNETGIKTNDSFYWNFAAGAFSYRLQVSLNPDFTTTVIDQSNLTRMPFILPFLDRFETEYYWRVKAANPFGTGEWSDTWKFTTIKLLRTPFNDANCVSINPNLDWNDVQDAISYHLQVSLSPDFTSPIIDQSNIMNTSFSLTNLNNFTTYYWRVNCTRSSGTLPWSNVWKFTTFIIQSPVPLTPVNDTKNVPINDPITFTWDTVPGATSYNFYSSFYPDQRNITSNSFTITSPNLEYAVYYYWRVSATNGLCTSKSSEYMHFTTIFAPPRKPTLLSPVNDEQKTCLNDLGFNWYTKDHSDSYFFQLSLSPDFASNSLVFQSNTTDSEIKYPGILKLNTRYYWRVNATNISGTGDWSDTYSFTTFNEPPYKVTLNYPPFYFYVMPHDSLRWSLACGATSYRVQVSKVSDGIYESEQDIIFDQDGITSNSIGLPNLSFGTDYWWRVRSINSFGTRGWSERSYFQTYPNHLGQVSLFSPKNNSINLPAARQELEWIYLGGAAWFRLQVSQSADFSTTIFDDNVGGVASIMFWYLYNLRFNTTYYWRAKAFNPFCEGKWSDTWKFTTEDLDVVTPPDNATNLSTDLTLRWSPISEAISYSLQVWTENKSTELVLYQPYIMSNSYTLTNLKYNTTYYWRVNYIKITSDTSEWSDTWKFTTEGGTGVEPVFSTSSLSLKQNHPNPFSQSTKIEFYLPKSSQVVITVFNVLGIKISTLLNKLLASGNYSVDWVPPYFAESGIYYYQFRADEIIKTRRMIYNKQ